MSIRHSRLAACATALALVIAAAHLSAKSVLDRREFLTFRTPVALPGVELKPGTYVFEVANPDSATVVRIRDRESRRVAFMGFTYRIDKPVGLGSHVLLGESVKGAARPVLAWYPLDGDQGYQFIYPDRR